MKKYEFTGVIKTWVNGKSVHQIIAVKDFGDIHAGDIGGFIEKTENLSHNGNAWVTKNAVVCGDAMVYGNALVTGHAMITGEAHIYGNAAVGGQVHVSGNAWICGDAHIGRNGDYICANGIGGGHMTAFTVDGNIVIVTPDYVGDIDGYLSEVSAKHGNGTVFVEAHELTELIKLHFGLR